MPNRHVEKLQRLAALSPGDIAALEQLLSPRQVRARHHLIREGDRPGPVFVMLEGWAIRYKVLPSGSRQIVGLLMPGDACDLHVGLLAQMDHSIETITPAAVATIERMQMDDLLARHPQIAKAVHIAQLIDEGTLRAWITSMGRRNSVERVAL